MIFFRPKFRKLRLQRNQYPTVELNKIVLKSLINSSVLRTQNKII